MAHRDLELIELTRAWHAAVVFDERERLRSCWFGTSRELGCVDLCEGVIQGAHWLKRQRVRRALEALEFDAELIRLAEWDARNGVPACEKHHARFDLHRTPFLYVPRLLVPSHVEEFAVDWSLETQLEDRNPRRPNGTPPPQIAA
jgi:hypothetical protein